jgi:hypothetical protein
MASPEMPLPRLPLEPGSGLNPLFSRLTLVLSLFNLPSILRIQQTQDYHIAEWGENLGAVEWRILNNPPTAEEIDQLTSCLELHERRKK